MTGGVCFTICEQILKLIYFEVRYKCYASASKLGYWFCRSIVSINVIYLVPQHFRIISDIKDTMYPSREMFSKLKWMPITDRIKYRKAIMVFKSINNLSPRYMSDLFKFFSKTHCRVTKYFTKTVLPMVLL